MKNGSVALYQNLAKHNGGIHIIVGRVGSGKTAALFSFCEHLAPVCYSSKNRMLLICSDRRPSFDKQVNNGELRQFFVKDRTPYFTAPQIIKRRLDCIEGVMPPENREVVRLGSMVDIVEFHKYDLDGFSNLIKDAIKNYNYHSILTDVDLNALNIPHESDMIAARSKIISSFMKSLANETMRNNINLYLTIQAKYSRSLDEIESIPDTHSVGSLSLVHMANSIFAVQMNRNGKIELELTSIKNRYGNMGEKFYIPFQWKI